MTYKPSNYNTVMPYIVCKNAAEALEFYKNAFSAKEMMRLEYPNGGIGHAEFMIGDSVIMIADEHPDMGHFSPTTLGNSPVGFNFYVPDCDAMFAQAIAAGATEIAPVAEQFYGDRSGRVKDPYGYTWHISTSTKDLSPDEMQAIWNDMMKSGNDSGK